MTVSATPTARAAWLHAALVAVVVAGVVSVPTGPWRPAAEIPVFLFGIAAARVALLRHRTPSVVAWRAIALGLSFFALSSAAEVAQLSDVDPGLSGALETGLDIAAYAAMAVGALGVVRGARRRRDRSSTLDVTTLLLAGGLALLAVSHRGAAGGDFAEVGIGTPVLTAVLLVVCVPLAMSGRDRSSSTTALLAAAALTVVGYGGRMMTGEALRDVPLLDPLPLLAVAALTLAARHPSVADLGGRPDADGDAAGHSRVLSVGATLLISPALLILWTMGHGGTGYLLGAGTAVLTALALWRLASLDADRERTHTALAASEARLSLLLENAADVIAIVDASGTIAYMSPAVQTLLGRPPSYYLGATAIELADERDRNRLRAAITASRDDGFAATGVDTDIRVQHASGGTRWVEMRISGRVDAAGIEGWVVNFREVTDRKMFEDELRRQARTDPLTGLLNRAAFSERLRAATATVDPATPPAVLFVDIDDFKTVNDTLGHAAGDELLITVASRLTADVRADDVVARLGGDEFAVLLTFADGERLRDVADRLLVSLRAPMALSGTVTSVTASIGGALGAPGDASDDLLHRADTAMYDAKRTGKNSHALVSSPGH